MPATLDRHAFESYPPGALMDETDVNLRAYVALMPEEKLRQYDPSWTDEQLMEWDGNFKNDDTLMLICSEREVDPQEFRDVIEHYFRFCEENGAPLR